LVWAAASDTVIVWGGVRGIGFRCIIFPHVILLKLMGIKVVESSL
jgi:hypothetical protein